jgi:hypothetical protein
LNVNYELRKKEYLQFRAKAQKEVDNTFKAVKDGKTIEDLKKPPKFAKAKQLLIRLVSLVILIRILMPKEYVDKAMQYFAQ